MNNKQKKGPAVLPIAVLVIIVLNLLRATDFDSFEGSLSLVFAAIVGLIVLIPFIARIAKTAAEKKGDVTPRAYSGGSAAQHSHDRLSGYSEGSCGDMEHWKKQLDGFLAAGLIDREEYRVLLQRRGTQSQNAQR